MMCSTGRERALKPLKKRQNSRQRKAQNRLKLARLQDTRRQLMKMHTELKPMAREAPGIVDAMAAIRSAFGCLARARMELGYEGDEAPVRSMRRG